MYLLPVYAKDLQLKLCNPTAKVLDILCHLTKIYGPKLFLLSKIKLEYSNILYNTTHFPGPLVCRIRQVFCTYFIHLVYKGTCMIAFYIDVAIHKTWLGYLICCPRFYIQAHSYRRIGLHRMLVGYWQLHIMWRELLLLWFFCRK
jgi:hypothetical protein